MGYCPIHLKKSIESYCNRGEVSLVDLQTEIMASNLSYDHFIGFYKYYTYAIEESNRIKKVRSFLIDRIKTQQWNVSDCTKIYKEAYTPIITGQDTDVKLERAALYILKNKVDFTLDDHDKLFWIIEGWDLDYITFYRYLNKQYKIIDGVVAANEQALAKKQAEWQQKVLK